MMGSLTTLLCLTLAAATPADHALDPFEAAETVRMFTFDQEKDRTLDKLPQPTDWSRRRGPLFPEYVEAFIDPIDAPSDYDGQRSLQFTLNGGQATYYSPAIRIATDHSYGLEAKIRTAGLVHDAAFVSLSFLNYKRERIERHLSQAVMGTHGEFQTVRVGPFNPKSEFKFVVIGCHLMAGAKMDIHGDAWFDDIRLVSLPLVTISTHNNQHYFLEGERIQIEANVSGRDAGRKHQLVLELETAEAETSGGDSEIKWIKRERRADDKDLNNSGEHTYKWDLSELTHNDETLLKKGFYRVRATFMRDGVSILQKLTTFAVMERARPGSHGNFGWSLTEGAGEMDVPELAEVAAQGGVNWVKYPLWTDKGVAGMNDSADVTQLVERLTRKDIKLVGLLNHPPKSLMDKFAEDFTGSAIGKIFNMPNDFWYPSLEPVIASYSFRVRHWQLGDESDKSFVGMKRLPQVVDSIKQEFDRVGRNVQIGVHWDWTQPLPQGETLPNSFLSLNTDPTPNDAQLQQHLERTAATGIPRWVLIKPLSTDHQLNERAADLVRRMMVAQLGGADAVFAYNPFDPEFGLLYPDGSPTELFLPWRTTALALQESTFLGKFQMPNNSPNVVFAKPGEVLMVIWNDQPTTEKIYLGEDVEITDLFGRTRPAEVIELRQTIDRKSTQARRQQVLQVGPVPIIVRKCSEPVARFRLAMQFQRKRVPSEFGEHQEMITGTNTFGQGITVSSDLKYSDKWNVEQLRTPLTLSPNEAFQLPVSLSFPRGAGIGDLSATVDFNISADREYHFTVHRPYTLGLGKVKLDVNYHVERKHGHAILVVEQIITNITEPLEILNFNCNLLIPGRRRQKRSVVKLGRGEDRKFYRILNADSLIGKEISLRAVQVDGKRFLNKSWTVEDRPPVETP
ncbi:hypothetical protein [Symmachiella dynata]|uniref:hypothetical protein n=1 Tax=Symmachiella dynata TaxID=2527995 RepID=UPI0030EC076B